MTPEGKVKRKVSAILKELGVSADPNKVGAHGWYFMPVAGRFGKKGVPDYVCNIVGYFVAIETKANGGDVTGIQNLTLDAITMTRGIALVIDESNIGQLKPLLSNIIKHDDRSEGLRLSWRRKSLRSSKADNRKPRRQSTTSGVERHRDWKDLLSNVGS